MDINDTDAIKALLDRLRTSNAWQSTLDSTLAPAASSSLQPASVDATIEGTPRVDPHISLPQPEDAPSEQTAPTLAVSGPSVASLLSELAQASSTFTSLPRTAHAFRAPTPSAAETQSPPGWADNFGAPASPPRVEDSPAKSRSGRPRSPERSRPEDLRGLTFQQALPRLAQLAQDPSFVQALHKMRTEQAELERQLFKERGVVQQKHEERVRAAQTKARIVGAAGLTQYEADTLTESFRAELQRFDRERVLPAWDGLLAKQQAGMEALGVPVVFQTADKAELERQQKVMQVLGSLTASDDSAALGGASSR